MLETTRANLETALARAPWDRELRLIYADFLEECGDTDAAEDQRRAASRKQRRRPRGDRPGSRDVHNTTASNSVFRKLHKRRFAGCDRCPWHRGDNAGRRPAHSSWKKHRKHRWRPK
jgi:uncharacterized protein (TIGR02996 family)